MLQLSQSLNLLARDFLLMLNASLPEGTGLCMTHPGSSDGGCGCVSQHYRPGPPAQPRAFTPAGLLLV
jgi:hypothetical protein